MLKPECFALDKWAPITPNLRIQDFLIWAFVRYYSKKKSIPEEFAEFLHGNYFRQIYRPSSFTIS